MRVEWASEPGDPGRPNEDWCGFNDTVAVVLDGVTSPPELPTGCIHDVPWYVKNLGEALLLRAVGDGDLRDALADAIRDVRVLHEDTCDLNHPGVLSSTVAMVRERNGGVDWLVLSDSTLVLETPDGLKVITDKSVESVALEEKAACHALPIGTSDHTHAKLRLVEEQRRVRNTVGGYWLAAANPHAARHSKSGSESHLLTALLMSDGVACLVDTYASRTWDELIQLTKETGSSPAIEAVRNAERFDLGGETWSRYKTSDDATIVCVRS